MVQGVAQKSFDPMVCQGIRPKNLSTPKNSAAAGSGTMAIDAPVPRRDRCPLTFVVASSSTPAPTTRISRISQGAVGSGDASSLKVA
jgi:hypothetical protein